MQSQNSFSVRRETARRWVPSEGYWYPKWVRDQVILGIGALQILNLFWYFLILRILVRCVRLEIIIIATFIGISSALATSNPTDERSDDEDDGDEDEPTVTKAD